MGQKDIISKQIFKRILIDVATYIFKLQLETVELIETEQQRIEDRRADLVARVIDNEANNFILHIEIQNNNQINMPDRMLRYLTDIRLNYPGEDVVQYLLYIGKEPLTMPNSIQTTQLDYHYRVIDMHEMDYHFCKRRYHSRARKMALSIESNRGNNVKNIITQSSLGREHVTSFENGILARHRS